MNVLQLQRQFYTFGISMMREGYLDDQFIQLQRLADENNPNFVLEIISIFFRDTEKVLNQVAAALGKPVVDFSVVSSHVHQFKGSSSSVGVKKIKNLWVAFQAFCEEQNVEGCIRCLHQVRHEYAMTKGKLETLLSLEQQILAAGGAVPMLQ